MFHEEFSFYATLYLKGKFSVTDSSDIIIFVQVVLSIEPYTHKFMEIWGIFPENAPICQGKFG